MKTLDEHNKGEVGALDSADVKCDCGGEMRYVLSKEKRNAQKDTVMFAVVCDKCYRLRMKYVFVK